MSAPSDRTGATVGLARVRTLRATNVGTLYAGSDGNRNQDVWAKELATQLEPAYIERAKEAFERELRALFKSASHAVVKPLEIQLTPGANYAVFPDAEAEELTPIGLVTAAVPPDEAGALIRSACEVLVELHEQGVTFAVLPVPYLFRRKDGSLAWHAGHFHYVEEQLGIAPAAVTQEPLFVAPEIQQGHADERSLVFSVAAWGYLMLAGPENRGSLESAVSGTRPRPLYMINDAVPSEYAQALERGLRGDPNDRYQTFAEFVAALARCPQPVAVAEEKESRLAQMWGEGPLRRIPFPVALCLAILGVVFAGVMAFVNFGGSLLPGPDPKENEIFVAPEGEGMRPPPPTDMLSDDLEQSQSPIRQRIQSNRSDGSRPDR